MATRADNSRTTIIRRLEEHGGFPAMAEALRRVNSLTSDSESSVADLAKAILDDYALTNKVLRVVNSAIYGRPTEVTTISRAIVVLGWNPIRRLVLTLKLFDTLPHTDDMQGAKALMGESFCTGMVARNVAMTYAADREEQAFICGLFHQFGEVLVHFYLPEQKQQIVQLVTEKQRKLSVAASLVLGMSFAELGIAVARELSFPKLLLACMNPTPPIKRRGNPNNIERMSGLTALAGRLKTVLLGDNDASKTRDDVQKMMKQFEKVYGSIGAPPDTIVRRTLSIMEDHATIMGLRVKSGALVEQISGSYFGLQTQESHSARQEQSDASSPEEILANGIIETKRASVRSLNDVLLVVLETMFRGMRFAPAAHSMFLIRDPGHPQLSYRCGFGAGLDDAEDWLKVPLNRGRDVFNIAINQRKDVVISDISTVGVTTVYPSVLHNWATNEAYAVILPLIVSDKPIGVFFLEGQQPHHFDPKHLDLLKGLRDQVVSRIEDSAHAA